MRENELLPVPYFHVVFTLPDVLNKTALHEPKMLYDILFESAWETLQTFGKNKNLQMGMIAVFLNHKIGNYAVEKHAVIKFVFHQF